MSTPLLPEQEARKKIDKMLAEAGWQVQSYKKMALRAAPGVAVCEYPLEGGLEADYLLFVDRRPVGVVEAKAEGTTLSGVESQAAQYCAALPPEWKARAWRDPLPFRYESTGVETYFANDLDPESRSRRVFAFHRPETLREWVDAGGERPPVSLRGRLQQMPPLMTTSLWRPQIEAIQNLEVSLAADRPRALIQMATGSGKTFTAVNFVYRLIKFAGARRVLFMVDRRNLGQQALNEFQQFVTPDTGRKFPELYNVQLMTGNAFDRVSKVCISTVQRLYAMLRGEELDPELEERSLDELSEVFGNQPREVVYNPGLAIEDFDFIVIDECHRSIYNLWRQVLEYFDAYLIGLTATPSKQTLGFFNQNLVMEYTRAQAVLDGVNVDGWVYRIRTQVTEGGSTVEAGEQICRRDRLSRRERWEQLDEEMSYDAAALDREVVAPDQIRTVIRTYRDRLGEIYPGRTEVPKTLVFAKDDSHAEDIVRIIREEFGKGDQFCQKITYRVSGKKPEELIAEFRTAYYPRIAVTVDMIATGTDVKPLEVLLFLRRVSSANYFEQMLGRGTRVVDDTTLQSVTPDALSKTHFVIVDAVGAVEHPKVDVGTLDRKRTIPLDKLLLKAAQGTADEDELTSLAVRLSRLEKQVTDGERAAIAAATGGVGPAGLAQALWEAFDPDRAAAQARAQNEGGEPTSQQIAAARAALIDTACVPFDNPEVRELLLQVSSRTEQVIDTVTRDRLLTAGYSVEDTQRAREMVANFQAYLEAHRDEITALQVIFAQPQSRRALNYQEIRELSERLAQPPNAWTTDSLWRAYAQLERDRVRGANSKRVLSDLVALVRHAVQLDDELIPYPEQVGARYRSWLAAQEGAGRQFTPEQRWWLDQIAGVIGQNLAATAEDFAYGELFNRGGWVAARKALGDVPGLLSELNRELA